MARAKASSSDFLMDFSKEIKPEGGGIRVKPSTYLVRIGKTKVIRSSQKGTIGLMLPCVIMEGKNKKKKIVEKLWLSPKAFHRFRELLEACGKKAPAGKTDIRKIGRAVEGEEIYINVEDDKQEGYSTKSVISFQGGFISPDDFEDDSDEDDEDDDFEDEESDDEDEDDDDLDDDEDEDEEEDDDEDEDDEEEEPAPRRRRKTSSRKPAKKAAKKGRKRKSADDDDLDNLDLGDFD